MTTFTNVFGGSTVQPAQVSYGTLALTANTTLVWPLEAQTGTDRAPLILEVTPSAGFSVTLPPANQVSRGQTIMIRNMNQVATTFGVNDNAGSLLLTAAVATVYYLYVTNNTTAAGVWGIVAFGASTAPVNIAAIAGPGTAVYGGTQLTTTWLLTSHISNFTLNATSDRESGHIWIGGVGTATLPSAVTAGNGYTVSFSNQGGGSLTVSGAQNIDGAASMVLQPSEEAVVVSDGAVWWTRSKSLSPTAAGLAQIQAYALGVA